MADQTNEGILTYTCPETRRAVATAISTDGATLEGLAGFKISVWCPHCVSAHAIVGKDAILVPVPAVALRSNWAASTRL